MRTDNAMRIHWLAALLLCGGLGLHVAAAPLPGLPGQVRDSMGNLLEGVELLVVDAIDRHAPPVATARTDRLGRFVLRGLGSGAYRFAALKEGYLTAVGRFSPMAQSSFDLVLQPIPAAEDGAPIALPEDAAWALRLPRRSVLRELGPVWSGPLALPAPTDAHPLSVEIDQSFGLAARAQTQTGASGRSDASDTRLRAASALGGRGTLLVEGGHDRYRSAARDDAAARAGQRETSAYVGMNYDTGPGGTLAMNAFYGSRSVDLGAPSLAGLAGDRRGTGADAVWSRHRDDGGSVAVKVDFRELTLAQHETGANVIDVASGAETSVRSRRLGAEGVYEHRNGDGHATRLALRAEHLDWPSDLAGPTAAAVVTPVEPDLSGWSVRVDASDRWAVAAPLTLVYGLGLRQNLTARETSLIVPHFGGMIDGGGWRARFELAYHAVGQGHATGPDLPPDVFRPETALGYEAELALTLADGFLIQGSTRYAPIELDPVHERPSPFGVGIDPYPVFVTDGNAAVREHRLAFVGRTPRSYSFVELAGGQAAGSLMALVPFEVRLGSMDERAVRYTDLRFGVHVVPRGTDVLLEVRRQSSAPSEPVGAADRKTREDWVNLRVRQALMGSRRLGEWRLLFGLRVGRVDSAAVDDWLARGGDEASLDALNRRLSAGVSVLF